MDVVPRNAREARVAAYVKVYGGRTADIGCLLLENRSILLITKMKRMAVLKRAQGSLGRIVGELKQAVWLIGRQRGVDNCPHKVYNFRVGGGVGSRSDHRPNHP